MPNATFRRKFAKPEKLHDDITKRNVKQLLSVDLYVAGFPCQPFSGAGLNEGAKDKRGREKIFPRVLEYIETKSPSPMFWKM